MIRRPCSRCGSTHIDKSQATHSPRKDGKRIQYRLSICKMCINDINREWYHANKDKRNKSIKEWRKKNKDKVNSYRRKSYAKKKRLV